MLPGVVQELCAAAPEQWLDVMKIAELTDKT
jgi:hypothetical protein